MVRSNYIEPNKITSVGWVDKALDLTFISCQGSWVQGFGHLTLGLLIQKMALVLCTHCKIKLRNKKNQRKRMLNKFGQNI
jgi:hypothetical protein